MARPLKPIDPERVEQLAAVGCPPNEIASALSCGEMTLHRRFGTSVKKGHDVCKTRIRSRIFAEAMAGNSACLIFLAKAICGLRERDDAAVTVNVSQTAITLAPQQLKANLTELRQAVREEAKRFVLN